MDSPTLLDMAATPLQAALDVLDRAQALLSLDPGSESVSLLQYDLRRQALTMGVAALDTWMHWSIRKVNMDRLSKGVAGLEVPFGELVESGRQAVQARNQNRKHRPQVRARNVLNEKLLKMTFQNSRQWENGLSLLDIKSGLKKAGQQMTPPETRDDIAKRLDALSHRRNKIVHEGDLRRLVRPRTITRQKLVRARVDDDLAWIRRFLAAVDTVR